MDLQRAATDGPQTRKGGTAMTLTTTDDGTMLDLDSGRHFLALESDVEGGFEMRLLLDEQTGERFWAITQLPVAA
jgi:hypothetical protein